MISTTSNDDLSYVPRPTLPGAAYTSPEIFAAEADAIFFSSWMALAREEEVPQPGDLLVRGFAGERFLLTRDLSGTLHAFYDVCRHRGTLLVEDGPAHVRKAIKCPYHAWTYGLDGRLLGTPNIRSDEHFDRGDYPLRAVDCDTWEGFVFVNASDEHETLLRTLEADPEEPMQFARYGIGSLGIGVATEFETAANWKIVIDNYNECLHCPGVHPELVSLVPVYRTGSVEEDPHSWGVTLADGATSFTRTGRSSCPPLPGIDEDDRHRYYGCHVFPNLFLDLTSDCVTYDILLPEGPGRTRDVGAYLFHPETIAASGFDPSDIVEFGQLVTRQDVDVCERAQRGVGSRAFADGGVLPFQDRYLDGFRQRYLSIMER